MHNTKKQRLSLKTKLRGNTSEKLHKGQGGLSGPRPLRSDGSHDIQAGGLVFMSTGQKQNQGGLRG